MMDITFLGIIVVWIRRINIRKDRALDMMYRESTCPWLERNSGVSRFPSILARKEWILIGKFSATIAKIIFNRALGIIASDLFIVDRFQVLYSLMTKRIAVRSWPSSMPCTRSTRRGSYCRKRRWNTTYNTCQKMTRFTRRRRVSDSFHSICIKGWRKFDINRISIEKIEYFHLAIVEWKTIYIYSYLQ